MSILERWTRRTYVVVALFGLALVSTVLALSLVGGSNRIPLLELEAIALGAGLMGVTIQVTRRPLAART
jgi:hypothetical protein